MIELSRRRVVQAVLVTVALLPCIALLAGRYCGDVEVYRAGGRAVLDGHAVYDVRVHEYGFTYPPFGALLGVSVALMPQGVAIAVLTTGSLASLAMVLRHSAGDLLRRAYRTSSWWPVVALAALIASAPVHSTVWSGQIDLMLAALVLSDVHGRRWHGVGVGLAAAVKLTPAIFVLYLVMCGRRREARNAVATFAVVAAGMWVVLPQDSIRYWTQVMVGRAGIGDMSHAANQSLYGVASRAVGVDSAGLVWGLLVIPTAALGLRLAREASAAGGEPLALGVVGVTGCLLSPVSWLHHWVWCVPLLAGLVEVARRGSRSTRWAVAGLAVAFSWPQLWPLSLGSLPPLIGGNVFVGPVVLAAGWATWSLRARRSADHEPQRPPDRSSTVEENATRAGGVGSCTRIGPLSTR